jgi:hypothetical protein
MVAGALVLVHQRQLDPQILGEDEQEDLVEGRSRCSDQILEEVPPHRSGAVFQP